jgi:hypothetical protein
MPLSEHEQRILEEIERRLAEEDPKFARGVSASTPLRQTLRKLKRAIAGFLAGFVLLLVGLFTEQLLIFGIVGFAVMLPCAVVIAGAAKQIATERTAREDKRQPWIGRVEERWKKRFDKDEA